MSLKNKGRGRTRSVIFKVLSWAFGIPLALIAIAALACVWLHATADLGEPEFVPSQVPVVQVNDSLRRWGSSSLRIDPDGLYEMRVCGGPFERGEAIGKLGEDLLYQQEKAFADKLFEMVPSSRYRAFLHYFITIFNRRMGASVPLEYRQEIKAMSASCTHEFDEFGSPYERQMQYHSAHDIGHVMQDYMLVGCTSFAVWGRESADSSLLMARNFDFYMGEEFAKNKLVLFEKPDSGYAYVSVTWPGMLGVVSGMNTQGLAVTINASKLEVPSSSATPISILVKSILQYASNIEEAETIAASFKTFVCESILVGSANDGRAVIIEKTPSAMGVYSPEGDYASSRMTAASSGGASAVTRIICTNHYQSDRFRDDPVNVENIRVSDSGYRYRRVQQLLDSLGSIDYLKAAAVLRDIRGVDGEDVGYCNDLSINQMLAMHSVIFKPAEKKIWVSTSPWQFGKFVCFDLDEVFGEEGLSTRSVRGDGLSDSAAHFTGVPGQATHSGSRNLSSGEESAHFASVDVDQRTCGSGSASHLDSRSLSSCDDCAHFARVDVDQRTCGAGSASHSDSRNLSSCDDCAHFARVDVDQRTCRAGSARHLGCTLAVDSGFSDDEMSIPADKFLETEAFRNVLKFKAMQQTLATASKSRREVPADSLALFVSWNPSYYGTYVSVASYLESLGKNAEADEYYRRALTCPMKLSERQHLETQLRGR
ncbi:MAG: C45 family autoproteolytic acyltransferase/hydrolase [Bacteroides sp.]|nr:C45 family autoproteolytic acyltransferase/hydrolase [Bacteroides sp.]